MREVPVRMIPPVAETFGPVLGLPLWISDELIIVRDAAFSNSRFPECEHCKFIQVVGTVMICGPSGKHVPEGEVWASALLIKGVGAILFSSGCNGNVRDRIKAKTINAQRTLPKVTASGTSLLYTIKSFQHKI